MLDHAYPNKCSQTPPAFAEIARRLVYKTTYKTTHRNRQDIFER